MSFLDKVTSVLRAGREVPDPTPVSIPVKFKKAESVDERIARITRHSLSKMAEAEGYETFDEADDFDISDDPLDPSTPWEQDFDLASAQSADHGITTKPDLSPDRFRELKAKYSRKPEPQQLDIQDAINKAVENALNKAKDAPQGD